MVRLVQRVRLVRPDRSELPVLTGQLVRQVRGEQRVRLVQMASQDRQVRRALPVFRVFRAYPA